MKKLLFVNACLRGEKTSRTLMLCRSLLHSLQERSTAFELCEIDLSQRVASPLLFSEIERRETLSPEELLSDPSLSDARLFASADLIVIAAPYWDLSFPAALRVYLEQVCHVGTTFRYASNGRPEGLCRAKRLVFVTTAGGFFGDHHLGYDYLCALGKMLGIEAFSMLCAEGLDIKELDAKAALDQAFARIPALCEQIGPF